LNAETILLTISGDNGENFFKAKNDSLNEAMNWKESLQNTKRRAMNFHSDNPFFIRPLHPSYLEHMVSIFFIPLESISTFYYIV